MRPARRSWSCSTSRSWDTVVSSSSVLSWSSSRLRSSARRSSSSRLDSARAARDRASASCSYMSRRSSAVTCLPPRALSSTCISKLFFSETSVSHRDRRSLYWRVCLSSWSLRLSISLSYVRDCFSNSDRRVVSSALSAFFSAISDSHWDRKRLAAACASLSSSSLASSSQVSFSEAWRCSLYTAVSLASWSWRMRSSSSPRSSAVASASASLALRESMLSPRLESLFSIWDRFSRARRCWASKRALSAMACSACSFQCCAEASSLRTATSSVSRSAVTAWRRLRVSSASWRRR
mmetsp:Transcript_8195/g.27830  ORF Transcript_8195/g.27830 Transcript_8195/m.27830 type:complete len:294 (+) Transcript_8195:473-1354(+)